MSEFVLYSIDIEPYEEELIDLLCNESDTARFAFSGEPCIWDEHEDDLRKFSKFHKDFVFSLYGQGPEAPEVWIKHFKNGKMQHCPAIITFDEFNEKELK